MVADIIGRWEFRILLICSVVLVAERLIPWRKKQPFLRPQLGQDALWFLLNALALGTFFGFVFAAIASGWKTLLSALFGASIFDVNILEGIPFPVQVIVALVAIDFVEWGIHNLLHRVPVLWQLHRVHHSIHHMDWIGNFRFHPLEIFFYYSIKYVPVLLLGAPKEAVAIIGSVSLLIGNLNHANIKWSYGPFRYILNSPRMHIWHHDTNMRGRAGTNFGITLSVWDWLFRTAYMPLDKTPERLGFGGDAQFPNALWRRILLPFLNEKK